MSNHSLATRPALPDPDLAADERRVDARAGSEPAVGVCIDGRFVLREHRGKGGMADVWLAKDRSLRAPVAVKILRVLDSETQQRFAAEAEVLANLRHPHIVQVLAAGRTSSISPARTWPSGSGGGGRCRGATSSRSGCRSRGPCMRCTRRA